MGWFDTLRCQIPLPGVPDPDEYLGEALQTKSFAEPADAEYEITATGGLIRTRKGHWDGSGEDSTAITDEEFLYFYPGIGEPDIAWEAIFQDGQLRMIERVDAFSDVPYSGRAVSYFSPEGAIIDLPDQEYRRRAKLRDREDLKLHHHVTDHVVSEVVEPAEPGGPWKLTTEDGTLVELQPTSGCPTPQAGMHLRTYECIYRLLDTDGSSPLRGLELDGHELFYELPEQERAAHTAALIEARAGEAGEAGDDPYRPSQQPAPEYYLDELSHEFRDAADDLRRYLSWMRSMNS